MFARLVGSARHFGAGRAARGQRACAITLCSLLLASAPLGCAGSTQLRAGVVYDYPVYYLDAPPASIWRYPRAYYHGRPAYLVEGRWYYSSPRGWAVFRREPRELRDYRENRSALRYEDRYRSPRRDRPTEPTQRRHRESWDAPSDEPSQRRQRRVDPD
jgi:hypothetical protein